MTAEKITVTIPHELKERLVNIKDELKTSMSAIYKEALEAFHRSPSSSSGTLKIYI